MVECVVDVVDVTWDVVDVVLLVADDGEVTVPPVAIVMR